MLDPLAQAEQSHPNSPALLLPYFAHLGAHYAEYSFARLSHIAALLAARLVSAGVRPGDRVALLMDNPHRAVELIHAAIRARAVVVPLNTRLTADEIRYQIEAADCTMLLCDNPHEAMALEAARGARVFNIARTPRSIAPGLPDDDHFSGAAQDYAAVYIDPAAVQAIIFTSGTTGRPKGAQITYGNWLAGARASAERIGARAGDRWLLSLPLYHVGGLSMLFRSCLDRSALVGGPPTRDLQDLAQTIEAAQVTLISLVPTQLYRLLEMGFQPPESLRLILLGGAAASPDLLNRCCDLGLPVAPTYGLTEAASQVATLLPDDACRKPGSVGKPIGQTRVRVVGADGELCAPGEIGEIVVTGPTVMKGYLGAPPVDPQDGFHSGDLGTLDADGDLWIVQRRTDLIVSGGENVYPSEVENVLKSHPEVADACVVGVPDAEWGQRVAAMIVRRDGSTLDQSDLTAYARGRLAGYKVPRMIVFVGELPLTGSGKVRRSDVAKALSES